MKKIAVITLLSVALAGCSVQQGADNSTQETSSNSNEDKLMVATSFYPIEYFAKEVGGDVIEVQNVTPVGGNPHNVELKPSDIKALEGADVFMFNGLELDPWAENIAADLEAKGVEVINVGEEIEGHEEASLLQGVIPAANAADDHGHGHDDHVDEDEHGNSEDEEEVHSEDDDDDGHGHGDEDPHLWINPSNAAEYIEVIEEALSSADAANAVIYKENAKNITAEMNNLAQSFNTGLRACKKDGIVVAHDAFSLMAEEYNFETYAVAGLSPDQEPSPREYAEIQKIIQAEGLQYIFVEPLTSDSLVRSLAEETNTQVLTLNPLEGLTQNEIENGEDYQSIMKQNLQNLQTAMECSN